jgi:hypothetical protein
MTTKERKKAERVKEIMRLLDCTEEEALDVVETDEIIDKVIIAAIPAPRSEVS